MVTIFLTYFTYKNLFLATHPLISIMTSMLKVLVTQSYLTLSDPMDCSPPGSSVHRIFQARILEWLPFPSLGDLPNSGIKPGSPALQTNSLPSEPPGKPLCCGSLIKNCFICLSSVYIGVSNSDICVLNNTFLYNAWHSEC